MKLVQRFQSAKDFWDGMLVPDYEDFVANVGDLRKALHSANSLFHMHDWVFNEYRTASSGGLLFNHQNSQQFNVSSAVAFADALEQIDHNFALIRGIANAGKHLALRHTRPHPDAPSNAANTSSQSLGWGEGAFGVGPFGGGPQVMLEGATGHLHLSQIAKSVYEMWVSLKSLNNW